MAGILLISSGIPSPLNAVAALGVRLVGDGHRVTVAAPASAREVVTLNGLDFREIPPVRVNAFAPLIARPTMAERLTPSAGLRRAELAVRAFGVDRLPALLAEVAPDLVIVDAELHAHAMIAHVEGRRVALCSSMYSTPPSSERPPLHYKMVPGRGVFGRLAVRMAWLWYWLWRAFTIAKKKVLYRGGDYASAVGKLARKIGFDLPAHRDRYVWQMPWSLAFPTLILLPAGLDFGPREAPRHSYLGPMILTRRKDIDHGSETIARYLESTGSRRILAVSGSILTPTHGFLMRVWEAVAARPDWTLLSVVGRDWEGGETPPDNVLVTAWAPQMEVLAASDAILFPGGSASIVEAVATGTPMLIYPRTLDQYGNAARVVHHGLGRVGDEGDDAGRIGAALDAVLTDTAMHARLQRFREAQELEREDRLAEREVARLLGGGHA